MIDRIQIGQEDQRDLRRLPHRFYETEDIFYRRMTGQGPQVCFLNDRSFGNRIGKGNADFYQISTGLFHGQYIFAALF